MEDEIHFNQSEGKENYDGLSLLSLLLPVPLSSLLSSFHFFFMICVCFGDGHFLKPLPLSFFAEVCLIKRNSPHNSFAALKAAEGWLI